jgi:hypothetical protein
MTNFMKISIAILLLVVVSAVTTTAQTKTAGDVSKTEDVDKFIEKIAGEWKLLQIVDESKKKSTSTSGNNSQSNDTNEGAGSTQSDEDNNAMQMLQFDIDGRYKMNNATTSLDSGSYRLNEQHAVLYLESDSDDITPTEWNISHQGNELTLVPRDKDEDHNFKYVYRKVTTKVSTN